MPDPTARSTGRRLTLGSLLPAASSRRRAAASPRSATGRSPSSPPPGGASGATRGTSRLKSPLRVAQGRAQIFCQPGRDVARRSCTWTWGPEPSPVFRRTFYRIRPFPHTKRAHWSVHLSLSRESVRRGGKVFLRRQVGGRATCCEVGHLGIRLSCANLGRVAACCMSTHSLPSPSQSNFMATSLEVRA